MMKKAFLRMHPPSLHLQTQMWMETSVVVLQNDEAEWLAYMTVGPRLRWPPSNIGCRRKYIGSEEQAEPVVVLDPVSTPEPQTKDQAAEKDPAQHKEDESEMKPENKEDSAEKLRETDSSSC
ncbi:Shootin-1 [Tupaia chinensis]|uniref:Shootin-1 n=1 Tax=Tupaia chinensis TaxID=246437 RepID=L9L7T4_TUPCH|nr:Shootin-1 [Tupaia chinensis]